MRIRSLFVVVLVLMAVSACADMTQFQEGDKAVNVSANKPLPMSVAGGMTVGTMTLSIPVAGPTGYATDPVKIVIIATSTPTAVSLSTNTVTLAPGSVVAVGSLPTITATPTYTTPVSDSHGSIASWGAISFTLGTNTVTLLSSVATLTQPCTVTLRFGGAAYGLPNSVAATATVAAGWTFASGDVFAFVPGISSLEYSMTASTTAACPVVGVVTYTKP